MKFRIFCCINILMLSIFSVCGELRASMGGDEISVTVKTNATVTGDRIFLGEIADMTGGSESMRAVLESVDLGPAPRPAQGRRMTGNAIRIAVEKTVSPGWQVVLSAPEEVVTVRASQSLSEDVLVEKFKNQILQSVGNEEVVLSRISVRGIDPLPLGQVTLSPATHETDDELLGNTTFRYAVAVDGEPFGQVSVSGWIDRYAEVVCAGRTISRNTILSSEDLCLKRMNLTEAPRSIVLSLDEAVGKRVRSTIQEGKCLQQHKLYEVPMIERGDRVRLLVKSGPLSISTLGIAKTEGGAGEQIRVENISSEKTVVGKIVDESTVEVLF